MVGPPASIGLDPPQARLAAAAAIGRLDPIGTLAGMAAAIHPGPIASDFQRKVEQSLSVVMNRDAGPSSTR